MSDSSKSDPFAIWYEIELLLQQIKLTPTQRGLHHELRTKSLRYKAAGGRNAGMFERMRHARGQTLEVFLYQIKLLCYDPADIDRLVRIIQIGHHLMKSGALPELEYVVRDYQAILKNLQGENE